MISYDEALERLLALAEPLPLERVEIAEAAGRPLAEPVGARRTQPPFAASAMDGYALRSGDAPGPWRVVGESAAGALPRRPVRAGEAMRIFTGAALPAGADAVLIQEDAARDGDRLLLTGGAPAAGAYVRPAGMDFREGEALLASGVPLSPAMVGLAAAAGWAELPVRRRPRVALLATGDELHPPGEAVGTGGIVESNRATLRPLLAGLADVLDLGIARDDPDMLRQAIARGGQADVLVTIGGASVGDRDLVQPVLRDCGADIDFWKVAIRPGKPMLAGRLGDTVVVGLPGNPASAYVTALLFVAPLLRSLAGWGDPRPQLTAARLEAGLGATGIRRDHLRARLGCDGPVRTVTPAARQDSNLMLVLAQADALIVRAAGAPAAAAGEIVAVLDIANRGL